MNDNVITAQQNAVYDQSDDLPDWIFDIDDEDDVDINSPLLQELEIDINQIYR